MKKLIGLIIVAIFTLNNGSTLALAKVRMGSVEVGNCTDEEATVFYQDEEFYDKNSTVLPAGYFIEDFSCQKGTCLLKFACTIGFKMSDSHYNGIHTANTYRNFRIYKTGGKRIVIGVGKSHCLTIGQCQSYLKCSKHLKRCKNSIKNNVCKVGKTKDAKKSCHSQAEKACNTLTNCRQFGNDYCSSHGLKLLK